MPAEATQLATCFNGVVREFYMAIPTIPRIKRDIQYTYYTIGIDGGC